MIAIKEGTFQMLKPIFSRRAHCILVGAIVGAEKGMAYTKRVECPDQVAGEVERIRIQIYKDHPGIKEVPFSGHARREALLPS